MLNIYIQSLIYRVREHSINQGVGSIESARSGITELQKRNTARQCYMNGKHRKAESERYNNQDLDYNGNPGSGVVNIQVRVQRLSSGNLGF